MKLSSKALTGRIKARRCAVQALYQWQLNQADPRDILNEFTHDREFKKVDLEYFQALIIDIVSRFDELQSLLAAYLDRKLDELDPIERAVLLIGTYELKYRPEVPWRVSVNEAIELAKLFGADQAHKYINGVLDKLARDIRPLETQSSPVSANA